MKNKAHTYTAVSTFPIDLVYLWVDGSDPKWLTKYHAALAAADKPVHAGAIDPNRMDSQGELMYSLRSVQKYLPWINHIYIITNEQTPAWLNVEYPRVSIVDHRDVVPEEFLPTFNSMALQLFIHRIPGLSEHFILSSDDMFVGAPLNPDFFFNASGDPIVMMREKWYTRSTFSNVDGECTSWKKTLIGMQIRNGLRLVYNLTGLRYHMFITHAMEPMRKSYLEDIFARHGDKIIPDTATPFRDSKNIQRIFFPLYNHANGRTDLVAHMRLGTERIRLSAGLSLFGGLWRALLRKLPVLRYDYVGANKGDIYEKISRSCPSFFNINNSTVFAENIGDMEKLFPEKSAFEK